MAPFIKCGLLKYKYAEAYSIIAERYQIMECDLLKIFLGITVCSPCYQSSSLFSFQRQSVLAISSFWFLSINFQNEKLCFHAFYLICAKCIKHEMKNSNPFLGALFPDPCCPTKATI
ncbi:hypothetical protein GOODEAATRI_012375 [Goodea atripinnis]|uniref:Uncharacterized protein n=1 Tax=Goodea atripinnis TaxID=208336 RepID=A0ABV0PXD8_9TELE